MTFANKGIACTPRQVRFLKINVMPVSRESGKFLRRFFYAQNERKIEIG
jgi:hypothetical protein